MRRHRWIRLLAQGLGVTASILLAFAVDAGWDYRQDRQEEAEALARLRTGFRTNRARLIQARDEHRRILDNAILLIEEIDELRANRGHVVPDSLLPTLWNWQTYDPVNGTLVSLLASGDLGLIRNDSLRTALASWPDRVADLNEDEAIQRAAVRDHFLPLLAGSARFRRLLLPSASRLGIPPPPGKVEPVTDVLLDPRLENWLVDRIEGKASLLGVSGEIGELLGLVDRILRLLEGELA